MVNNSTQAAQAYANVAKQLSSAQGTNNQSLESTEGFGTLVKSAIDNTIATGQAADAKAATLANGRTDIVDLVTAVAETEVAVQSMVAVRDRVISAYQEILNMPV